jgi:hypothetical protein
MQVFSGLLLLHCGISMVNCRPEKVAIPDDRQRASRSRVAAASALRKVIARATCPRSRRNSCLLTGRNAAVNSYFARYNGDE